MPKEYVAVRGAVGVCVSDLQWVPGFRRWGRLICPDPPYNPFATYLPALGPVYHLSRLRLILLDSEAQHYARSASVVV